jgi:hypothetical protein
MGNVFLLPTIEDDQHVKYCCFTGVVVKNDKLSQIMTRYTFWWAKARVGWVKARNPAYYWRRCLPLDEKT